MRGCVWPKAWERLLAVLCVAFVMAVPLVGCSGASNADGPQQVAEEASSQSHDVTGDGDGNASSGDSDVSWDAYDGAREAAVEALESRLAAERKSLYVYKDYGLTQNHFTTRAKMFGDDASLVGDMDENWRKDPRSGDSCIRCRQTTRQGDWGGWLLLNGRLSRGDTSPQPNDGTGEGQGLDLTGAEELRFWAKGTSGGEVVEFFCAGFGYDGETNVRTVAHPDSARKRSLGEVTLTDEWREYSIDLSGADLSCIACGFGYVMNGDMDGDATREFCLDEIRFEGHIKALQDAPMMLCSYDTSKASLINVAFSYDNALVALALMSEGKDDEAASLLDAFVYAADNDRSALGEKPKGSQGSKRVRNAYVAGDFSAFPGWESGARLPGFYDKDGWAEDSYQAGSDVGSASWVALALLHYYRRNGGDEYLDTARSLMDWVATSCTDKSDGFTDGEDGNGRRLTYKSCEHNVDALVAFRELYSITGEKSYGEADQSARRFVESMYDEELGLFMTGTVDDGVTPNGSVVVLDAQVWSALALGEEFEPFEGAIDLVTSMRTDKGGYPFCQQNANGGWWAEGTAYTALMWRGLGDERAYAQAMDALVGIQLDNGLFPAATVDNLFTGMRLSGETPWEYSRDAHIAPTAWFVMAANGFNPYEF